MMTWNAETKLLDIIYFHFYVIYTLSFLLRFNFILKVFYSRIPAQLLAKPSLVGYLAKLQIRAKKSEKKSKMEAISDVP